MELISKAASILLLPIMVCVGCANNDLDGLEDAVVLQRWLESTGDPVLGATLPCYEPVDTLLSPEVAGYEYYFIESFVIDSNRVYISDGRMNTLLAFSHDGAMLWKTGGTGEGPGLFSNIGQLAVSGDTVAACNMASSRVDLFSATDGHWLSSIPVYWPFDVEFLPNGNLVVASLLQEDLITIFTPNSERVLSFGSWDPPGNEMLNNLFATSNRNIQIDLIRDSVLAVNSYYFNWNQIYDLHKSETPRSFRRDLPFPEESVQVGSDGMLRGKIYMNDITACNDLIYVLLRPISTEWDLPGRFAAWTDEDLDFSMIDVFNIDGQYIGSFAFRRCVGRLQWHNGNLYGATDETGELIRFAPF